MASVKICLRKRATADNKHSLFIQIIKDRKKSIITLGHNIALSDWDEKNSRVKKTHPNSARLNNMLSKKLADANDKLIELQTNNTDTRAQVIGNAFKAAKEGTFFKQAKVYCNQLSANGKFNQLSADEPRINRFKEFLNNADINFSEIDVTLLKKFKTYLKSTRKISERTIVNHLVVIRTIFNQGIIANLVEQKYYPFGKGKIIIKFPETVKVGLNADEIKILEAGKLNDKEHHARNKWLIAFYFAGMRASDVLRLKWSDFQNGRLYYQMGKNAKIVSIKVPDKAIIILNEYKRENPINDLVFPDLEVLPDLNDDFHVQAYIKARVKFTNKYLQRAFDDLGIEKEAGMHKARHAFGEAAGDTIPIQMLQKLYRHTHVSTTISYQGHFMFKDTDDALDSVLNS